MPLSSLLFAAVLGTQSQKFEKPYRIVELPKNVKEFATELPKEGEGRMWREGDVLKAIYRNGKADRVDLSGGIQEPMAKFEGTDYWGVQFKYDRWDQAIVAYIFVPQPIKPDFAYKLSNWMGEAAPKAPEQAIELKGKMTEKEFETKLLATKRTVRVYTPPNAAPGIPFIVVADGQGTESYAKILEPLILAGKVRPLALIGIDNGGYIGDRGTAYEPEKDLRAKEYLRAVDEKSFDNHLKWVTNEVLPWARQEFNLSAKREDTGVFGFSNGGSFSAAAAARFPDVFGVAFPFSAGIPPEDNRVTGKTAKYFFAAGSLESFSMRTKQIFEMVRKWGAEAQYEEYEAGHDSTMWQIAFVDALPKAFPPQ